jgi:hypothetical protein
MLWFGRVSLGVALSFSLAACGSSSMSSSDPGSESMPQVANLLPLYAAIPNWSATALAFDPTRAGELWVTLRQFPTDKPCLETARSGCAALEGKVALVQQATSDAPTRTLKIDGNAWHFMRRPTSISFGDNGNLSTCGEARTDNYEDEAIDYSGPVLWSSDPTIFGVTPTATQNGTHIDMLHETPFCMGVAYEHDNVYWAFNGQIGALDRYDFHAPHVIGGEDHSDGELHRYVTGELSRVPEVPSHLALDHARGELYIADTGHARIVRLAIDSGTPGADVTTLDPIRVHRQMDGVVLEEVVPPGTLTAPSGITFTNDTLFVTDNATSKVWSFKRDGTPNGSFETDLPSGTLSGVALGPDGKLYLSDLKTGAAYRVEAR